MIVGLASMVLLLCASSVESQTRGNKLLAGKQMFATSCSGCHGSDGRGGERAPNIATVRRVVSLSDMDLQTILRKGVAGAGMPSFGFLGEQKINDVVAYVRVLQGVEPGARAVAGDAAAGRAIFFGKGGCSKCHMIAGNGGFIAPDLSDYGSGLSEAAIRRAIAAPDLHLQQPGSGVVELRTANGEKVSGIVRSEDNFTLVLQTEDGRFRSYDKGQLANVRHTSHSLMPEDFATRLSSTEMQDLIRFLATHAAVQQGHAQERNP